MLPDTTCLSGDYFRTIHINSLALARFCASISPILTLVLRAGGILATVYNEPHGRETVSRFYSSEKTDRLVVLFVDRGLL